ncbi:MAG: ankyrin repeat domain-containing protein [Fimbriimonas sp.]
MDFPPLCALCWLVPGIWVAGWLLTKKPTRIVRWVLTAGIVGMLGLSGLVGLVTYRMAYDEMLMDAVQQGNLEAVEIALSKGANPHYRFDGAGDSALELARAKGNREIAARMERAAKEGR